jgi:hypothetical protein
VNAAICTGCKMRLIALFLVAVALSMQAHAASPAASRQARACISGATKAVKDSRIREAIANARKQHALFGGQLIDRAGGIVAVGFHEAEFDRPAGETTPTWKRVAQFWAALDEELPSTFQSPAGIQVNRKRLFDQIASNSETNGVSRLDEKQLGAVQSAFLRSALVDQPWSAAFISFLMKESNFTKNEFEFSDSHVDYVDKAVLASSAEARGQSTQYAYRACDVATTMPRPGDMICYTRDSAAGIDDHAKLLSHLETRRSAGNPAPVPMHCEVVTSSDENGNAKIETIGGNVFQSVTLRRMTLNAEKTLSRTYFPSPRSPVCTQGSSCGGNLSRNSWVVLLQFRN